MGAKRFTPRAKIDALYSKGKKTSTTGRRARKRRSVAEAPDPPTVQCKNCNRVIYETDANEHGWCVTCIEEANRRLRGHERIKVLEEAIDNLIGRILDHGVANMTGDDLIELVRVRHPSETK